MKRWTLAMIPVIIKVQDQNEYVTCVLSDRVTQFYWQAIGGELLENAIRCLAVRPIRPGGGMEVRSGRPGGQLTVLLLDSAPVGRWSPPPWRDGARGSIWAGRARERQPHESRDSGPATLVMP